MKKLYKSLSVLLKSKKVKICINTFFINKYNKKIKNKKRKISLIIYY